MSSRRGRKQPLAGPSNSPSPNGQGTSSHGYYSGVSGGSNSHATVDQLNHDTTEISLDSSQDGDWEVFSKKSKNRAGANAKQWAAQSSAAQGLTNAWSHSNVAQKLGVNDNARAGKPTGLAWQAQSARQSAANVQAINRSPENNYYAPPTAVAPPLQHGWQWGARTGFSSANPRQVLEEDSVSDTGGQQNQSDAEDEDDDLVEDDDDDDLMSDDFDSDESVKSHETRKNHKWFKSFFKVLNKLTVEELNEPSRQWHCPACKNGPGAIDWYRGLQPLMTHAKTIGSKRVKLHRELAELLDEELIRRGTSAISAGETFGKWEGLREAVSDREIVWPPMVIIMNTQLSMDENDEKWIGMGNPELFDYFSSYEKAVKARHSYGPRGHRGMSILIFENSAVGYLDAERLHNDFASQGTDRDAWDNHRVLYKPGGKRQLYGYMARKEDLDNFNKHCQGKMKLKFELRSYQEMVVVPMRQMSEDNQQLVWYKNKVVKEQKHSKAVEESFGVISQKLRKTMEENRIVRERTKLQHSQNKEELDHQEEFFRNQISIIHQTLEDKEKTFEELLQEERKKMKESISERTTQEEDKLRRKEIADFIQIQSKGIEQFEAEREKLIKIHQDKKDDLKRRYMADDIELEKEFESALSRLMAHYAPHSSKEGTSKS